MTHFAFCRNEWAKHGEGYALLLAFVDEVKDIVGITAQSIQARDYQFVPGPQEFDDGRKFG